MHAVDTHVIMLPTRERISRDGDKNIRLAEERSLERERTIEDKTQKAFKGRSQTTQLVLLLPYLCFHNFHDVCLYSLTIPFLLSCTFIPSLSFSSRCRSDAFHSSRDTYGQSKVAVLVGVQSHFERRRTGVGAFDCFSIHWTRFAVTIGSGANSALDGTYMSEGGSLLTNLIPLSL
jgi:hypothetical protein